MICCTPGTVFAWVGALFINVSFGFLIAWSLFAVNWILGFSFSLLYTFLLFFLTYRLSQYIAKNVSISTEDVTTTVMNNTSENYQNQSEKQGLRTLITLLGTLAVVSIGVTGLIIPLNVFYCEKYNYYSDQLEPIWKTNVTSLPDDVFIWYNDVKKKTIFQEGPTFEKFPSGKLLFSGRNDSTSYDNALFVHDTQILKVPNSLKDPRSFTLTSNGALICMTGNENQEYYVITIACYNGTSLNYANHDFKFTSYPVEFYSSNYALWFVTIAYSDDMLVFSLDETTMDVTQYNYQENEKDQENENTCDFSKVTRQRALTAIFTSVNPTILAALLVMRRHSFIPTMPIVIYSSITGLIVSFTLSIKPEYPDMALLLKIWFSSSSGLWILASTFSLLLNRISALDSLDSSILWSLPFASLVYFIAMSWALEIPLPDTKIWWKWVIINIAVYVPYIFFGIITEQIFLVLFGAVGIFINVWKFSSFIASFLNPDSSTFVVVQVLLFAFLGLLVGLFGWLLNRRQHQFQVSVRIWINRRFQRFARQETEQVEDDVVQIQTNQDLLLSQQQIQREVKMTEIN